MNNLKIAKQIPFKVLVKRVIKRLFPSPKENYIEQELRDSESNHIIKSLLRVEDLPVVDCMGVTDHYLKHEFDLLGSGWVNRNSEVRLELGSAHVDFSKNILTQISKNYQLIGWQLDVRSGFQFNIKKQFDDQTIDRSKNVDIKNCWELGRLHHFPQMALAAKNLQNKDEFILEFKNQSLDFIVSNPIGMGVQWVCTMDVGIRVSNWLVAFDLFKQQDNKKLLDNEFTQVFTDYIQQHAKFIIENLEGKEGVAGNHYLFNLIGLLFATNYLSEKEESLAWRTFTEEEIEKEFFKQFFADGGNFEGSTTYHCLSTEAMVYATALMLRNDRKVSSEYIDLLSKSCQFVKDLSKPNGEMPQFGDNDSGRLFVFSPFVNEKEKGAGGLNYDFLLAGFSGLFGRVGDLSLEAGIVQQLAKKSKLVPTSSGGRKSLSIKDTKHQLEHSKTTLIKFDKNIDIENVNQFSYDEFGVYVFKSAKFYLAISAISNKKMHHSWGHVHNDKLSFDLQVNKTDLVKDPGTFTYSAFPEKRMEYRGVNAHNGIVVSGVEQNKAIGLFYLERESECSLLEKDDLSITLQVKYYGVEHVRKFEIFTNQLVITDYCNKPFQVNINKFPEYSPKYGVSEQID